MVASAVTRFPLVCNVLILEYFLSVSILPDREWRCIAEWFCKIQWQATKVALLTMFCPAASPVVKLNRRYIILPTWYCSMFLNLPVFVVLSAFSRISSICSFTHCPKSRASRALEKIKTGARCMASSLTVVVTPPLSYNICMPRL